MEETETSKYNTTHYKGSRDTREEACMWLAADIMRVYKCLHVLRTVSKEHRNSLVVQWSGFGIFTAVAQV